MHGGGGGGGHMGGHSGSGHHGHHGHGNGGNDLGDFGVPDRSRGRLGPTAGRVVMLLIAAVVIAGAIWH